MIKRFKSIWITCYKMKSDERINLLADWLEKQVTDSSITDGRIWQKMAMSERTFYRMKPQAIEVMQARATKRQAELDATKTQEVIEAAKLGLKSRRERQLLLQKHIEAIEMELEANVDPEYLVINGKPQKINKEISVRDKAHMRKTIKELQAEISKMEGDYAPEQWEVTKPIKIENEDAPKLNYSKMPLPLRKQLLAHIRSNDKG